MKSGKYLSPYYILSDFLECYILLVNYADLFLIY
jgi:hypothetical protein